ncbi:L-glutamine:scyllo-inosose aminotransferase [Polystyrenella longa]|uniref:L-glutamine:scyllo-inosose aminotransferase n=1 Tax=Polystyrenella longa TaxID=2528007 RepID=A0A518CGM9_9PLAN|nr:aminotransferase class I/II-fold pyridoxal phosphate-dependent enzyme [Polystyrenella longa]QDU78382.1 L-glutamine:scyllo-inosose aminotransferase [Polystyrenella longa]
MSDSANRLHELPQLLGGPAVRPSGPPGWPIARPEIGSALRDCWTTGDWGRYHGENIPRLEELIRAFFETEFLTLCSSGSSALELALRGVRVGPGDEVIMAAYDFRANFQNITLLGATPVLVDLRPDDFQMSVEQIESAITKKTKAILVSHLHGGIVDLQRARVIADAHSLPIIEDACQCQGASYGGQLLGTHGDVGILSFGGSKLTTAGRGGVVITNNAGIAQHIKLHQERGNIAYPLSELQAAVLIPQWEQLPTDHEYRLKQVEFLASRIEAEEVPGLRLLMQTNQDHLRQRGNLPLSPGYYKVGFRYNKEEWSGLTREQWCIALRAEGIAFDPGFRSLHLTHSRRRFRTMSELPVADHADEEIVGLHHPVLLEPAEAIEEIVIALKKIHLHAHDLHQRKETSQ